MKTVLLFLLGIYRSAISPWLGPRCRFEPTCSVYAGEALSQHGIIKGLGLAIWRLGRCHPFARGGIDPVPQRLGSRGANE